MKDSSDTPELIAGFLQWVSSCANYRGLWRWISSDQSIYPIEEFKNDLWLAWLDSAGEPLVGEFISDARNRGLFGVLAKADYRYRKLRRRHVSIDALAPDGGSWATHLRSNPTQDASDEAVQVGDVDADAIAKRWIIRRLASVRADKGFDKFDLRAPQDRTSAAVDDLALITHVALSRRSWWRLMNG